MKKKLINIRLLSLFFLTIFITISCDLSSPLKDKETGENVTLLLLDLNFYDTQFNISFVDKKTGDLIDNKSIAIQLEGEGVSSIVNYEGYKNDSYTVTDGLLTLAVDPNIEVSEANPITFGIQSLATDFSYDALPVEITYTESGNYDIVIEMFEVTGGWPFITGDELKSASFLADEPFDIYAATTQENLNTAIYQKQTYNSYFFGENNQIANPPYLYLNDNIYARLSGNWRAGYGTASYATSLNLNAMLFPNSDLIKAWGGRTKTDHSKVSKNILPDYTILPTKYPTSFEFAQIYYVTPLFEGSFTTTEFGVTLKQQPKCNKGIYVYLSEKSGKSGSLSLNYEIYNEEGDKLITKGKLVFDKMPQRKSTGIIYAEGNVKVKFKADDQYDLTQSEFDVQEFCGEIIDVEVQAKPNLKSFKLNTSYKCENAVAAIKPSFSASYRKLGTTDTKWNSFKFTEGVAILQLEPGAIYEIKGRLGSASGNFDLPTNDSDIQKLVTKAINEVDEIGDIDYEISSVNSQGFVGTEIKIDITFANGYCPL